MPPIQLNGLRVAKQSSDESAESAAPDAAHVMLGRVRSVHEHHNGKHVEVNVVHGRKKSPPKATKGQPSMVHPYDDRPDSRVMIPKSKAKAFGVGTRVHVSIKPAPLDGDDQDMDAASDAASDDDC